MEGAGNELRKSRAERRPATVYGARAFAAFREFYDQRAASDRPAGQGQPTGHGHEIAQPNGHQHTG